MERQLEFGFMDDQYCSTSSYRAAIISILEDARQQSQTSVARDGFTYIIDYFFTAKGVSTEQLRTEVDSFNNNQPWYSKFLVNIGLKNKPPRIRAFQDELTERLVA